MIMNKHNIAEVSRKEEAIIKLLGCVITSEHILLHHLKTHAI